MIKWQIKLCSEFFQKPVQLYHNENYAGTYFSSKRIMAYFIEYDWDNKCHCKNNICKDNLPDEILLQIELLLF